MWPTWTDTCGDGDELGGPKVSIGIPRGFRKDILHQMVCFDSCTVLVILVVLIWINSLNLSILSFRLVGGTLLSL